MRNLRPLPLDPPPPPPPSRRKGRLIAALAAAILLAAASGFGIARMTGSDAESRDDPAGEPAAVVADKLSESVVQIETESGVGSGVVYRPGGLILTAAHVVGDAQSVVVRLPSGRRLQATVVGTDADTDVAVVRAPENLATAQLALDEPLQVGQLVVAIGSPFGLEGSVTSGIISAVDRTVRLGPRSLVSMIQTDASINPGNSGGALANRNGAVIGINDAIRTLRSGANSGVGFAIPIDVAAAVADAITSGRAPRLGFLGIRGQSPSSGPAGAIVVDVIPGTAAENIGLRPGDLIVAVGPERIEDMSELASVIRGLTPGARVTLEVNRRGRTLTFSVRIGSQ
jgi:putative serine protease PepD